MFDVNPLLLFVEGIEHMKEFDYFSNANVIYV